MCVSRGEDFASTSWPVVVKAKASVTPDDLAKYLEDIAAQVRDGFYMDVAAEPATVIWPGNMSFGAPKVSAA